MSDEPATPDAAACPQCAAPLIHVNASGSDATGPRWHEYRCANGHRVVVERREITDEPKSPQP